MTIDEIIAYIMHTPENTNPAILREQLNSIAPSDNSSSALPTDIMILEYTVTPENTVYFSNGQSPKM